MKGPESEKALLPDVTRFYKPIFGEGYSEFLYLPPKIAQTMKHMVDQETHLQDSTGKTWPITISHVQGLLAFHKGWHEFFLQRHLSIGQILVFECTKGSSCFSVKIYSTDACEILDFDQENSEMDEDVGEEVSSQSDASEVVSQGGCDVGTIENDEENNEENVTYAVFPSTDIIANSSPANEAETLVPETCAANDSRKNIAEL